MMQGNFIARVSLEFYYDWEIGNYPLLCPDGCTAYFILVVIKNYLYSGYLAVVT